MGRILPLAEESHVRIGHVRRVLRTGVLLCEEGTLQEDALYTCAHEVVVSGVPRLVHARASGADLLARLGECRGDPARGAPAGKLDARGVHTTSVAIHHIMAHEAMDVRVHVARGDPAAAAIDDLHILGSLSCQRQEDAVQDRQVTRKHRTSRKDEVV